jgi:hypothetical protein
VKYTTGTSKETAETIKNVIIPTKTNKKQTP